MKKNKVISNTPTCFLKIHQEYCDRILDGTKFYEFRKRRPEWLRPGCKVVLCCSDLPQDLLAWFEIGEIISGSPEEVWRRTSSRGGIDYDAYHHYYEGRPQAYAYEIKTLRKFADGNTVSSIMGPGSVVHSFDLLPSDKGKLVRMLLLGKQLNNNDDKMFPVGSQDENVPKSMSSTDERICSFIMIDAMRIRRMVQLMPDQNPTAEFLNMLWAYATKQNRLIELANVLLGFDFRRKKTDGNECCDWFWRCQLPATPVQTNEFFFNLQIFARTRAHLDRGTYDDWHGNSLAMLEALESYKREDIGNGIIGIDEVLGQLREKYESEVENENR